MGLKIAKNIFCLLPDEIRYRIARAKVRFPTDFPSELEVKIGETQSELEAAFRIVHDSYVEFDAMDPQSHGLRITKYHALPTTTTIIAKWQDTVVGVIAFIQDSALGLPMDSQFDLTNERIQGCRIGELSCFAIKKGYRSNGLISFSLIRYAFEYAKKYQNVEKIVACCRPVYTDLYTGVLGLEPLDQPIVDYKFAKGAPTKAFYWDLNNVIEQFGAKSKHMKRGHNFKMFFGEALPANFVFPKRDYFKAQDPVLTPEMMEYFFLTKTSTHCTMKEQDKKIIQSKYPIEFSRFLPTSSDMRRSPNHLRFSVLCQASNNWSVKGAILEVINVSREGLQIRTNSTLEAIVDLAIQIGPNTSTRITAKSVWSDGQGHIGLKILKAQPQWENYISYLQSDFALNDSHKQLGSVA